MTARKPRPPTESQGRALLVDVTASNAEIARTLGKVEGGLITREHVRQWRAGAVRPRPAARRALARLYGIPAASWDATPASTSRPPLASVGRGDGSRDGDGDERDDDDGPDQEPEVARRARSLPADAPIAQLREVVADLRAARRRRGVLGSELASIARAEGALLERLERLEAAEKHEDRDEELDRARAEASAWRTFYRQQWSLLVALAPAVAAALRDASNGTLPEVLGALYAAPPGAEAVRTARDLLTAFDAVEPGSDADDAAAIDLAVFLQQARRRWLDRLGKGATA